MATIYNNLGYTFTPTEQQAINNAAAHCGVDAIHTEKNSTDGNNDTLFDFYGEDEDYLFSIDTDADGGCVIFNK